MKHINTLLGMLLAALLLAGCAATDLKSSGDAAVKCPACGFEFNEPSEA